MSELTKKGLAVSLKKLLSKKELSKITISNITDECGVNRQTFYYHFKDIYDLLEWVYKNEVIDEIDNKDEDWQQRFLYIFKYVLKNKEFVKNTYNSISREYLLRFIYMQTNKLLIDFIDKESEGMNIKVEDKKFMADFYKYGFVGILQEWIEDGMKEEPEIIIKKLNNIIEGDFKKALEKMQK